MHKILLLTELEMLITVGVFGANMCINDMYFYGTD